MGDFLRDNWFWLVLIGGFLWMHSSGRGCGSHGGGHGGGPGSKKGEKDAEPGDDGGHSR